MPFFEVPDEVHRENLQFRSVIHAEPGARSVTWSPGGDRKISNRSHEPHPARSVWPDEIRRVNRALEVTGLRERYNFAETVSAALINSF